MYSLCPSKVENGVSERTTSQHGRDGQTSTLQKEGLEHPQWEKAFGVDGLTYVTVQGWKNTI